VSTLKIIYSANVVNIIILVVLIHLVCVPISYCNACERHHCDACEPDNNDYFFVTPCGVCGKYLCSPYWENGCHIYVRQKVQLWE
jgi:hypothetical protein